MSIFNRFGISNVEGLEDYIKLLSSEMQDKINLWLSIAQGKGPWNDEYKPSGVIPSIVGAIADPISEEMQIESKNERLQELMRELDHQVPEIAGNAVTCGASIIRPIYSNGKIQKEIIKLGYYIPTKYDFDGTLTGCVILKKIIDGKKEFLLLENHDFQNRTHSVKLELYKIESGSFYKTSLESCSQTQGMTESYEWKDVDVPFIVEIRTPRNNDIDFSSLPVALYGGHENLIEDCDRQYHEINWEQIAGSTTIFADEDMFKSRQGINGKKERVLLSEVMNKVVVKLNGNGMADEKIQTHSPALRTAQQIEAYQQILREIENVCRIGKGTLSNLQEAPQTATQFKGGKSVLYNTINTFESEFEKKYKHIAYIFAYMLSAYENIPFNPEITITYDESDRKDASMQRAEDIQEVNANIMNKWEYRMKHYGETEEEAKANVPEVNVGGFIM